VITAGGVYQRAGAEAARCVPGAHGPRLVRPARGRGRTPRATDASRLRPVPTYNRAVVPAPSRPPLRVALLGLGTVGRAVAERLVDEAWRADVEARGLIPPDLAAVGIRDPERARGLDLPEDVTRSDDLAALARRPDIDVVVELIGGTDDAAAAVDAAIESGKSVITANKSLVALHGSDLEARVRARGGKLRFEAAVAGGVPLLGPIVRDLAGNRIDAVRGIVNATTNHVLSAMARDARAYDDVLGEAQARGYAEADPTADVGGFDAADKLAILVRLCFGGWPAREEIVRAAPVLNREPADGITGVTTRELRDAASVGLSLKLVSRATRQADGSFVGAATMAAVPAGSVLAAASGIANVVELVAAPVGTVSIAGPGAGGDATSSSVLADLLALAQGGGSTWDPLPAAGAIDLKSDLSGARAWFVSAPELAIDGFASAAGGFTLVTADEALVTRPMDAEEARARLISAGIESATLYPVLEMGG
jgi:homoserine dehydrogenase